MLTDYANQALTLQSVSSVNEYNEPTYTTATIRGRKEDGFKLIRNAQGQEVVSSAFVMTETAVDVNDKIDGKFVIVVNTIPDLGGAVDHYEVYLQ
jgi:hypothetical protein